MTPILSIDPITGQMTVETPWGVAPVRIQGGPDFRKLPTCSVTFTMETAIGKAEASFYVEESGGRMPMSVRLMMSSGAYAPTSPERLSLMREESSLRIDGVLHGWFVQAWVDPATGSLSANPPVADDDDDAMLRGEAGVIAETGKHTQGDEAIAALLMRHVEGALGRADEECPGLAGKIYVALTEGMARAAADRIREARKEIEANVAKQERLAELRSGIEDAIASSAPRLGR